MGYANWARKEKRRGEEREGNKEGREGEKRGGKKKMAAERTSSAPVFRVAHRGTPVPDGEWMWVRTDRRAGERRSAQTFSTELAREDVLVRVQQRVDLLLPQQVNDLLQHLNVGGIALALRRP